MVVTVLIWAFFIVMGLAAVVGVLLILVNVAIWMLELPLIATPEHQASYNRYLHEVDTRTTGWKLDEIARRGQQQMRDELDR